MTEGITHFENLLVESCLQIDSIHAEHLYNSEGQEEKIQNHLLNLHCKAMVEGTPLCTGISSQTGSFGVSI